MFDGFGGSSGIRLFNDDGRIMNVLIAKTTNGKMVSMSVASGDYSEAMISELKNSIANHFSGDTIAVKGFIDGDAYRAAVKSGKKLNDENGDGVDFDVCSKAEAEMAGKNIVAPTGIEISDILSTDMVVCYV